MSTEGVRHNQPVVHVRDNSDEAIEALFSYALSPDPAKCSVPLRLRNLPKSFFTPPQPESHSRQGSADSSKQGSIQAVHPRTHSSPACLNQLPPQVQPVLVARQPPPDIPDDVPLPPGWEMAKTPQGQRYYMNHHTQSTTWNDPRRAYFAAQCQQYAGAPLGPLPEGWEQATTPEGESYFINHLSKTTSWYDPRNPPRLQPQRAQQPPPMSRNPPPQAVSTQTQIEMQIQAQQIEAKLVELDRQEEEIRKKLAEIEKQRSILIAMREGKKEPDPFLADHARQESQDSGLGNGPTDDPKELFSQIVNQDETMDSENLVPSLQEELPGDLSDIEGLLSNHKLENTLTWL